MPGNVYAGLPAEFSSPSDAASRIARLGTAAERLALLDRIPPGGWRWWVAHEAKRDIALAIADGMPDKEARQAALAAVPEEWADDVRALVLTHWRTRIIRAEYQAECAIVRGELEPA